MEPIILGDWNTVEDIFNDFQEEMPKRIDILFAAYNDDGCCGGAFVLYKQDDKYYEVHASHCSCFGLEDQWDPEETDLKAILYRREHSSTPWVAEWQSAEGDNVEDNIVLFTEFLNKRIASDMEEKLK